MGEIGEGIGRDRRDKGNEKRKEERGERNGQ